MEMIIDRIEGNIAVCEMPDGGMVDIPLERLPKGVRPGDVLSLRDGVYTLEPARRKARLGIIRKLENDVFN